MVLKAQTKVKLWISENKYSHFMKIKYFHIITAEGKRLSYSWRGLHPKASCIYKIYRFELSLYCKRLDRIPFSDYIESRKQSRYCKKTVERIVCSNLNILNPTGFDAKTFGSLKCLIMFKALTYQHESWYIRTFREHCSLKVWRKKVYISLRET